MTEQTNTAAERSAHVTRGGPDKPVATETRNLCRVEVLDRDGVVVRYWHTWLEDPPEAYDTRVRPWSTA